MTMVREINQRVFFRPSKPSKIVPRPKTRVRRNPGRNDGATYKASKFICPDEIGEEYIWDDDDRDWLWLRERYGEPVKAVEKRAGAFEINLEEIAKPAKARTGKGAARDFEMVDAFQRVIALEDYEDDVEGVDPDWESQVSLCDIDDEEWEDVRQEKRHVRMSYSAVLMGNPG